MIKGSIVALVTPMAENGSINWDCIDKLVDWHIEQGTDAILPVGTTGESATLAVDEHCQVIKRVVDRVSGRLPVIAGTGSNSTTEAIELTCRAQQLGVDACLLVSPYYVCPSQAGIIKHFESIADSVDIPQILYNVPARTRSDMLPETVCELAKHSNIVGIKDATGDLTRAKELISALSADFAIYSGDDETAMELMLLGGHGNSSVTANIAPKEMALMCGYALEGNRDLAQECNDHLQSLNDVLFIEANPIPVKWAMYRMGMMPPGIRLPLTQLSGEFHGQVEKALTDFGV
ncbi:MAG: 4-hydroxy-tetrahydrodipicolinate synthase [Neptuniibacter sp.]